MAAYLTHLKFNEQKLKNVCEWKRLQTFLTSPYNGQEQIERIQIWEPLQQVCLYLVHKARQLSDSWRGKVNWPGRGGGVAFIHTCDTCAAGYSMDEDKG